MINDMPNHSLGTICFAVLLSLSLVHTASGEDGLAADAAAARVRTGKIDPKCLDLPVKLIRLLDFDPEAGIKETVAFLTEDTDDPYRIAKRIHDWIIMFLRFDEERFFSQSDTVYNPEETLRRGSGISLEFAELFSRMCSIAGIESMVVSGVTNRYFNSPASPAEQHWNIVMLDSSPYIVDAAGDAAAPEYSDRNLLVNPRGKILSHFPDDNRYQLLGEPVEYSEFIHQHLWEPGLAEFGIVPGTGFASVETEFLPLEGTDFFRRRDLYPVRKEPVRLSFGVSGHIRLLPVLRDSDGSLYPRHALVAAEETESFEGGADLETTVSFSLPGENGEYEASIYAEDVETGKRTLVYRFFLRRGGSPPGAADDINEGAVIGRGASGQRQISQARLFLPARPLLPRPGRMMPGFWLYRYKCGLIDVDLTGSGGARSVTLAYPEEVEVTAVLERSDGSEAAAAGRGISVSYTGINQRKFSFPDPEPGRYFVKILGRQGGSGRFQTMAEGSFYEYGISAGAEPVDRRRTAFGTVQAIEKIAFREHYFEARFRFIGDNVLQKRPEETRTLVFEAPEEFRMDCALFDSGGNELPGASVYERYGNRYYFYFAPSGPEPARAEIYSLTADDERELVSTAAVAPVTGSGPWQAYEEGWLYRKNGFEDLGLELLYENLHRNGSPGYAHIELSKPAEIKLAAVYESPSGEDLRKGNIITTVPSESEKGYFFRLPQTMPVRIRIIAGRKTGHPPVDYSIGVLDFVLFPDPEHTRTIPPPGEIIFYEQFYRNGFEYISDTFERMSAPADSGVQAGQRFDPFRLEIRRPPGAELACRLYREDGSIIEDAVMFKVRNDRYIFEISPQPNEQNISGKIIYINRQGQWNTMGWFTLPR